MENREIKTDKPQQLLDQDEFVYLTVTLNKIPNTPRTNSHRIRLPHPLINTEVDSPELCLIIDDRAKSGLTKKDAKEKIESENIPITKVLKLSKLKTDYKAFEVTKKLKNLNKGFCEITANHALNFRLMMMSTRNQTT
ncbi:hypothetical protein Bca52824_008250 [Brassica carinata]|uniref:Uncharacterized protein n=1 Tax=Brassica carinata TaxID=52824 RepID=A0A8X8B8M1_BRACI|nr:hypothetical protein Bca52824_008250 [Brassica carinata]